MTKVVILVFFLNMIEKKNHNYLKKIMIVEDPMTTDKLLCEQVMTKVVILVFFLNIIAKEKKNHNYQKKVMLVEDPMRTDKNLSH